MEKYLLATISGLIGMGSYWVGCWIWSLSRPGWDNVPGYAYFIVFIFGCSVSELRYDIRKLKERQS